MPRAPKRRRYTLEEGLPSQSETVEEDTSSSSSTASSSLPSSLPSSFSSSSSYYSMVSSTPSTPEEVCTAPGTPSPPQGPPSVWHSPTAVASIPLSQSSNQEVETSSTSQALPDTRSLPRYVLDGKVGDLVDFLLLRYRAKELTTKTEMLSYIIKEYQDHFPEIFTQASECMQVVFGIDVKEVDPSNHSYVLVTTLGLTYDGMGSDRHSMPKTGILILILIIIFSKGDHAPEEDIWEKLSSIEVHVGMEHPFYGEPKELLTKILVQEQYVEYRQVPNSNPARYEFLWGPRAHAETSKLKILEFLANINGHDPRSLQVLYEQALRDQEEKAQPRFATTGNTTDTTSASSSVMSGGFSRPE